jgi:hypothetical protein
MNKLGSFGTQWVGWISGITGNEERPSSIALLTVGSRKDPVMNSNGRNKLIVYNTDGTVFCNILPDVTSTLLHATVFLTAIVRYNAITGAPIWAIGFDNANVTSDYKIACTSGLAVYVYVRATQTKFNKTYGQTGATPVIVDNRVIALAMGNPPSQAVIKFIDGVYQWVVYFNVVNSGGSNLNIATVEDQVFATLRFTGQFSFTGPVNSLTTPMFTITAFTTMVVHVAPSGFVTIISYVSN